MKNFGHLKNHIIALITELYVTDKGKLRQIINEIKHDRDFREMYLFYEEIENLYFEDKEQAILYIENITNLLENKKNTIEKLKKRYNKLLPKVDTTQFTSILENSLYNSLDVLCEGKSLRKYNDRLYAQNQLLTHLTTKKTNTEENSDTLIENVGLLYGVLVNDFNKKYMGELTEEEKTEFKKILSLTNEELNSKFNELKESTIEKLEGMLLESNEDEMTKKINEVNKEVLSLTPTKYNFYRLSELNSNIIS